MDSSQAEDVEFFPGIRVGPLPIATKRMKKQRPFIRMAVIEMIRKLKSLFLYSLPELEPSEKHQGDRLLVLGIENQ